MRRRDFLTLAGAATASATPLWPLAAQAQYTTEARYRRAFDKMKSGYVKIHNPSERARIAYVSYLVALRQQAIDAKTEVWKTINDEIKAHPAPANSDGKALAALLAGKWTSPQHDYLNRADGTWTMLPDDPGTTHGETTHGTWRIEGNQFYSTAVDPPKTTKGTIVLLTKRDFVFFDDKDIYYETRMK
jgi:hypothetical protein